MIAEFSQYKIRVSQNRLSFSMLSIFNVKSIFSGSRGPDGPDLPSHVGRKFWLSVNFLHPSPSCLACWPYCCILMVC